MVTCAWIDPNGPVRMARLRGADRIFESLYALQPRTASMAHEETRARGQTSCKARFDPYLARVGAGRMHLEHLVPAWLIERNASESIQPLSRLRKGRDDLLRRGGWFPRRPDTWFLAQAVARRDHDRVPAGPRRSALPRGRRSVRSTGLAHPSRWFGPEKARTAAPMLHRGECAPQLVNRWLQHRPQRYPRPNVGRGYRRIAADAVSDRIALEFRGRAAKTRPLHPTQPRGRIHQVPPPGVQVPATTCSIVA